MAITSKADDGIYNELKFALSRLKGTCCSSNTHNTFCGISANEYMDRFIESLGVNIVPDACACETNNTLDFCTSTPLVKLLAQISVDYGDDCFSLVERDILVTRCTFIASLPERLTGIVYDLKGSDRDIDCNWELLTNRICQALCCFIFAIFTASRDRPSLEALEGSHFRLKKHSALVVSDLTIRSLLRRGYAGVLFRHFTQSLLNIPPGSFTPDALLSFVLKSVYCCMANGQDVTPCGSNTVLHRNGRTARCWSEWVSWVLKLSEKEPKMKMSLISAMLWLLNMRAEDYDLYGKLDVVFHGLMREIFIVAACHAPTNRETLRIIYREVLPALQSHPSGDSSIYTPELELSIFEEVFHVWCERDFAENAPMKHNAALANSVVYMLLNIKERQADRPNCSLPPTLLQSLLSGISIRFESIRSVETKNEGAVVASAFAHLFHAESDGLDSVSKFELFPEVFNDWMKEEMGGALSCGPSGANVKRDDADCTSSEGCFSCLRSSTVDEEYPLNPDSDYNFFMDRNTAKANASNSIVENFETFREVPFPSNEGLLPFGKTRHDADYMDGGAEILITLRESYNALMGIGRSPGAQLYEVQQAAENGLLGFKISLQNLKKKIGLHEGQVYNGGVIWKQTPLGEEINTMIPSLIPALMTTTFHAPEPRHKELMEMRFSVVVDLIVVAPQLSLSQLGKMLYSNNFGIFQRVEMVRAIGEAAKCLSQVELHVASSEGIKQNNTPECRATSKRIYPPLPSDGGRAASVIVSEGKKTRRWGNSVSERSHGGDRFYVNYLSEVASFFISVFLNEMNDGHFSFFQDRDPHVPVEVLRAICIIVQHITPVRHVAPSLCESVMSFVIAVITQHPLSVIRRHGWILAGEVMRCWCGAGPLVMNDWSRTGSREGFGGHASYSFSQQWCHAQQVLEAIFDKGKNDFSCAEVALIVLADLRDLVMAKVDYESMRTRTMNIQHVVLAGNQESEGKCALK
ncbi:unnamed protein product [Trypanosoma congolense IL3000]|uniref:WGS project CAEQ00000000 data, annotated contig 1422 n=1 Tax=Trypanosoma congolense (strain IL3000) TaxID=1068625 RepID=F9W647_TRYCI|nr:unnamed protein product [Trypanosoma congolense IL3000]